MGSKKIGAAGVLVFVHKSRLDEMNEILNDMNKTGRVSEEVLFLFLTKPTREHVASLSQTLQKHPNLQDVYSIHKLKANNALRDLTAPWRLDKEFCKNFYLLVNLETVNPLYIKKYPHPNLTLPAGRMEENETPLHCAKRELFEECHIIPSKLCNPIFLMSGGMTFYNVYVTEETCLNLDNGVLKID